MKAAREYAQETVDTIFIRLETMEEVLDEAALFRLKAELVDAATKVFKKAIDDAYDHAADVARPG